MGTMNADSGVRRGDGGCQVLIVDDEPEFASLVAEFLTHVDDDLETTAETDPRKALSRINQNRFDCVVTDYQMPHLDGLGLIEAARNDVPFILFTQVQDDELGQRARNHGAAYVRKRTSSQQYDKLATVIREQTTDHRT